MGFRITPTAVYLCAVLAAGITGAGAAERYPGSRLKISVSGSLVSVQATDVDLGTLVRELGDQTSTVIVCPENLATRVSVSIRRESLGRVLRHVLVGHGFVLRYTRPENRLASPAPAKLWVFPNRARAKVLAQAVVDHHPVSLATIAEIASEPRRSDLELLTDIALFHLDPALRSEAVYGLGELGAAAGLPALELALDDPERRVRQAAVDALNDIGTDAAALALAGSLLTGDAELIERAGDALADMMGEEASRHIQGMDFNELMGQDTRRPGD